MEPDDLLAYKMGVSGPELLQIVIFFILITQRCHIIKQCVQPHIDHMARVKVHRYAPGKVGTGHAQVLEAALAVDEVVDHLVDPALGLQEIRIQQQVGEVLAR